MSDEKNLNQDQEIAEKKKREFLEIKDLNGDVTYTCTMEELEKVITDILMLGSFTKTFSLLNGKMELTFQTITDRERASGYTEMRKYTNENKDQVSNVEYDTYISKINIALQLVRVKISGNVTNLQEGDLGERLALLADTPELQLQMYSKWLSVFANITSKAFNYEDVLKNF